MRRLSDNVLQMGNRHFNYFLVGRRQCFLVECGVSGGVISLAADLQKMPEISEVTGILAMHEHFDHVCGIPALREMFAGVPVLAHPRAERILRKQAVVEDFFRQDEKMSDILLQRGLIDHKPISPCIGEIGIDGILEEGQYLPVEKGLQLQILETPGHSPCSLAAYLPGEQVMFLSDAAGYQIDDQSIFPIFFQGYDLYMESIKRLMGFPTRVLALPHGTVWAGRREMDAFYQRALQSAQDTFQLIQTMLEEGLSPESMQEVLFSRYYRDDLMIYTPENIQLCVKLLIQRVGECLA